MPGGKLVEIYWPARDKLKDPFPGNFSRKFRPHWLISQGKEGLVLPCGNFLPLFIILVKICDNFRFEKSFWSFCGWWMNIRNKYANTFLRRKRTFYVSGNVKILHFVANNRSGQPRYYKECSLLAADELQKNTLIKIVLICQWYNLWGDVNKQQRLEILPFCHCIVFESYSHLIVLLAFVAARNKLQALE